MRIEESPIAGMPSYAELYALAYSPGSYQCPKCKFYLQKNSFNAQSGELGTTYHDRQSEPCPNDGEILLPVSWKELYWATQKEEPKR